MKKLTWYILKIFSLAPFPLLYLLAYGFKFILGNLIRYRKEIILSNLGKAFPEKTDKELKKIASRFYLHYSIVFLETIKILSISKTQLEKRIHIVNPDVYKTFVNEEKGAVILTGHLGNFEWAGQWLGNRLPHPIYAAYRPFSSMSWEYAMKKVRSSFKTAFVPSKQILKAVFNKIKTGLYLVFLNDQLPLYSDDHCWVNLFNTETMFFIAPAKIARKFNLPVYYIDMWRTSTGYYEIFFTKLLDQPKEKPAEDIIRLYAQKLEVSVQQHPYAWLWSHKRWKRLKKNDPSHKENLCK